MISPLIHKNYYIRFIVLFCPVFCIAQQDTIYALAQFDSESLKIRWSSPSTEILRQGISDGWQISIYEGLGNTPVRSITVTHHRGTEADEILEYPSDSLAIEVFDEIRDGSYSLVNEEEWAWHRFALLFGLQDNFELSKALGMATEITDLNTTEILRIEVTISGNTNIRKMPAIVQYQEYVLRPIPMMPSATCINNRVTITADVTNSAQSYSSYYIEKYSEDDFEFKRINPLPLVENYSTGKALISHIDTIDRGVASRYRLVGKDIWGDYGGYSRILEVFPCHIHLPPPDPLFVSETDERGRIQLRWNIADSIAILIQGFNVFRSPEKNGDYTKINDQLLPEDQRRYLDETPLDVGYYHVEAIYKNDESRKSLNVVGILIDTKPPGIPQNVVATLDTSTMIATVTWDKVTDRDLKGYRVFYSNGENTPKFLLNNLEIEETILSDTLQKNALQKRIFYWVTTRDYSQNESLYSEYSKVEINNRRAPVPARITGIQTAPNIVVITYDRSPSPEVKNHILQKRKKPSSDWESIKIHPGHWSNKYRDTLIEANSQYEYRVMSQDSFGLHSTSNTRMAETPSVLFLPVIEYARAEVDGSGIAIYFDYPNHLNIDEFRVMGGSTAQLQKTIARIGSGDHIIQSGIVKKNSDDIYSLYRIDITENIRQLKYFKIRAASSDGRVSPYTKPFTFGK